MFEVLECAWAEFDEEINKAKDLDELIAAHERYLAQILNGAMMETRRKTTQGKADGLAGAEQSPVLTELSKMFDVILQFVRLQEHVYDAALQDAKMDSDAKTRMYKRQQRGQWGVSIANGEAEENRIRQLNERTSAHIYDRLLSLEETFARLLTGLRTRLSEHSSSDAQFLDVRLDFNEFYEEKRKKEAERSPSPVDATHA